MRLLKNATLVTAAKAGAGSVLIEGDRISAVWWADSEDYNFRLDMFLKKNPEAEISDLTGKHIIAGGRNHRVVQFNTAKINTQSSHKISSFRITGPSLQIRL